MKNLEFEVEIPVKDPLKSKEKSQIINELLNSFDNAGLETKVSGSHYIDRRGAIEDLGLVLTFVGIALDIISIALAIRDLQKGKKSEKKIHLKTGKISLSIEGKMSKDEILSIIEESSKAGKCQ